MFLVKKNELGRVEYLFRKLVTSYRMRDTNVHIMGIAKRKHQKRSIMSCYSERIVFSFVFAQVILGVSSQ